MRFLFPNKSAQKCRNYWNKCRWKQTATSILIGQIKRSPEKTSVITTDSSFSWRIYRQHTGNTLRGITTFASLFEGCSSQHTFPYFWGPCKCNYTLTNPPSLLELLSCKCKGFSEANCLAPTPFNPDSAQHTGRISTVLGVPLQTPSGLESPLFLSPCSLANLILLPFLPVVSWLRGIDKRLCVIPWLWKSQHLLNVPLSSMQHSHALSLIPGTKAEQRDMLLISKWLAPGKLFLYRALQFVLPTEHWHGVVVCG